MQAITPVKMPGFIKIGAYRYERLKTWLKCILCKHSLGKAAKLEPQNHVFLVLKSDIKIVAD